MVVGDRKHSSGVWRKRLEVSWHFEHHLLDRKIEALKHQRVGQGRGGSWDHFSEIFQEV